MPFNIGELGDYDPRNYDEAEPRNVFPPGYDPMQGRPDAMAPTPVQDAQQVASVEDGTPQEPVKQPGNRYSIKEYLRQIETLRAQQRAMGVPEEQLAVPTFTNIRGGGMDVEQGRIEGDGAVRSYVTPEWVQGEGGDLTRGPAHPTTMAEQEAAQRMGVGGMPQINNPFHPQYGDSLALRNLGDAIKTFEQTQNGGNPSTPEQRTAIANSLRKAAREQQAEEIEYYKRIYDGIGAKKLFKAFETGDFKGLLSESKKYSSRDELSKLYKGFYDNYEKARVKSMESGYGEIQIVHPETGEPFVSAEDYAQYNVKEFIEGLNNMLATGQELGTDDSLRADGTKKGPGYLGTMDLPGGGVATEYSVGVEINGKETQIPTLVPTLTEDERNIMINDIIPNQKQVPDSIIQKAIIHAKDRIQQGRSPFAGDAEKAKKGTAEKAKKIPGGKKVVRTGTYNGRKVVKYDDGSVEYAE